MVKGSKTAYDNFIQRFGLKENEPLNKYTSFKIGGPADLLALPSNKNELTQLLKAAEKLGLDFTLIGGGTNLLITDKGIRGLVIVLRQMKSGIRTQNEKSKAPVIEADAGERLASVVRFTGDRGFSGLEFAAGIPGTLGGALKMNAGTPQGRMSDVVETVTVLNQTTLEVCTLKSTRLNWSYRNLKLDDIILGSSLKLKKSRPDVVQQTIKTNIECKQEQQPVHSASAGCFFKNPLNDDPAGKLIEGAGLKGKKVNHAMVSDLHANYIINTGDASCKDVLLLKKVIQDKVFEKYGIKLETEVRIQGEK